MKNYSNYGLKALAIVAIVGALNVSAQTTTTVPTWTGGTVTLNTTLGNDSAAHDTLRITSSVSGSTAVTINATGIGGLTTNGYKLIDTTGATVANGTTFTAPDIYVGAFRYVFTSLSNGWGFGTELRDTSYQLVPVVSQIQARNDFEVVRGHANANGVWGEVFGGEGRRNDQTDAAQFDHSTNGVAGGFTFINKADRHIGFFVSSGKTKADAGNVGNVKSDEIAGGFYFAEDGPNGFVRATVSYHKGKVKADSYGVERMETDTRAFGADIEAGLAAVATSTKRVDWYTRIETVFSKVDDAQTASLSLNWKTPVNVVIGTGFKGRHVVGAFTYGWDLGVRSELAGDSHMNAVAGGSRTKKYSTLKAGGFGALEVDYAITKNWSVAARANGEAAAGYLYSGHLGLSRSF